MALLMPQGKHQYFTTAGEPLVGGKVYTYAAGTSTLLTTYSAQSGAPGTENTNPVVLDARGEATIFFGAAGYKVVLRDALDNIIWTQDNLFPNSVLETFTITDDLTFTGTGNRITGDFSNVNQVSRVLFQTSTANGGTVIGAVPNGTGLTSGINLYAESSDPSNCALGQIQFNGSEQEMRISATKVGTGNFRPMTFTTNDLERLRIDTSGNVLMTSKALLGYGTGAGSTLVQAAGGISGNDIDAGANVSGVITTASSTFASTQYFDVYTTALNSPGVVIVQLAEQDGWVSGVRVSHAYTLQSGGGSSHFRIGIGTGGAALGSAITAKIYWAILGIAAS